MMAKFPRNLWYFWRVLDKFPRKLHDFEEIVWIEYLLPQEALMHFSLSWSVLVCLSVGSGRPLGPIIGPSSGSQVKSSQETRQGGRRPVPSTWGPPGNGALVCVWNLIGDLLFQVSCAVRSI